MTTALSYSIHVTGRHHTESEEELAALDDALIEEAKKFVSALDGVASAHVNVHSKGNVNLLDAHVAANLETPSDGGDAANG